jgi:hypothetical protein
VVQCYKKQNHVAKSNEKVNVMVFVTEPKIFSNGLTSHFTPITIIADSGATCHMRGSLEDKE